MTTSTSLPSTDTDRFAADVLASAGPVLVDFTADWCGPCRMVTPVLVQVAAERPDLKVVQVDADANPELTRRYQVMGLPLMALFRGGELVGTMLGAKPRTRLLKEIDDILSG
jgi:thioredoxin 1